MSYQSTTPNFDLPQWQESDSFQMDDFNEAFSNIDSDVQKKITASGLLKGSGNGLITGAVANTDYATPQVATQSRNGLMSNSDKNKLDAIKDYITEQGSSDGWTYRKWSHGTAECWRTYTFESIAVTSPNGSLFQSGAVGNIYLPTGLFSEAPIIYLEKASGNYDALIMRDVGASTTTTGSFILLRGTSGTVTNWKVGYYAVGRWT